MNVSYDQAPPGLRRSVGLVSASGVAGLVFVFAAFRFDCLNWVVDGPGWLVSRFTSIDFHEGEGALGFFLAIFLSWFWTSLVLYLIAAATWQQVRRRSET
jgi:hypothetical protein